MRRGEQAHTRVTPARSKPQTASRRSMLRRAESPLTLSSPHLLILIFGVGSYGPETSSAIVLRRIDLRDNHPQGTGRTAAHQTCVANPEAPERGFSPFLTIYL